MSTPEQVSLRRTVFVKIMVLMIAVLIVVGCNAGLSQAIQVKMPPTQSGVFLDIPYIEGGGPKQSLDLYVPATKGFATILFVHGGSLFEGDRKNEPEGLPYDEIAMRFRAQGIGFAIMSYRLGPENRWPSQPDDVISAFDWCRKNISRYGGNPNKIFLLGHSSGAFLVTIVSVDPKYLRKRGYLQKDIAGVMPMGTLLRHRIELPAGLSKDQIEQRFLSRASKTDLTYGNIDVYNDANPYDYLSRDIPPMLILIAEEERFAPPILEQSAYFVRRATFEFKVDADLMILKDRTHMSAVSKLIEIGDPGADAIKKFVQTRKR